MRSSSLHLLQWICELSVVLRYLLLLAKKRWANSPTLLSYPHVACTVILWRVFVQQNSLQSMQFHHENNSWRCTKGSESCFAKYEKTMIYTASPQLPAANVAMSSSFRPGNCLRPSPCFISNKGPCSPYARVTRTAS